MFEVGRVCVKVAGRESGRTCVVVENIDNNFVLIDGNVRRRKCNVSHLEPLPTVLQIGKAARTDTVKKALQDAGFALMEKGTARAPKEKPVKKRIAVAEEKKPKPKPKTKAKKQPVKKAKPKPVKKSVKKSAKKSAKKKG